MDLDRDASDRGNPEGGHAATLANQLTTGHRDVNAPGSDPAAAFDVLIDRRNSDSSKWNRLDPDVIPLFVADMDFRAPEPIIKALEERVAHGLFGYPRVSPELREILRAYLDRAYGWSVDEEAIVLLPGVISGFNLAVRALAPQGSGVLMHTPAYPPILNCPNHHELERREAPLVDTGSRFEVDWDRFERAASGATVFLHCNPHNPTGRVFERGELERMAETSLRRGLKIVADEIHCDIVFGDRKHVPIAALDPEVERNTVTLMAPSKTFGLPGLKASFAVIPDEDLRRQVEGARSGLVPSVNVLGQAAMAAAYSECEEWRRSLLRYLEGNIAFLRKAIAEGLPGIRFHPPEGTYLAWLDCREAGFPEDDARAFFLERARVGLSDGLDFGPQGRGFARMCFASPRSLLEEALERMSAALRNR